MTCLNTNLILLLTEFLGELTMPPIRRKIIDVACLSGSSPSQEESDDDVEEVRVEDGVEEVERYFEPQDDNNGPSDSDESDFAQDVADASEGDDDDEDIEEPPPSSGGEQDKVEPLIKVGDILGKTKDSVREEVLLPAAISR